MLEHKIEKKGSLFVVATPIGNLEDITLRAVRTLKDVDVIASEDTRRTKILLNHLGITKQLISYYREKEKSRSQHIIALLGEGKNVALVSDAGTPCISDPGAILVQQAHASGIKVVTIPGVSALTAGLSVSGLLNNSFIFLGFPPNSKSARRKYLSPLKDENHLLVFYESPKRILALLRDILEIFADRKIFLVRELTKIHEEYFLDSVSSVLKILSEKSSIKGEFVIFVEGADKNEVPDFANIVELLTWYRDQGDFSLSDAVKRISKDIGIARSDVYKEALKIWP